MKLNELIEDFTIYTTNEEKEVLSKIDDVISLDVFSEREQTIIENLIRKSLVSKVQRRGSILVMANEL
jgi:UDP-N-acetylmuramate-alanine ligase